MRMAKTAVATALMLAAGVVNAGDSAPMVLDLRTGDRASAGVETLAYSSLWDGGEGATVTIAQDGAAIAANLSGEGEREWSVPYNGTYVLTHTTCTNGVAGKVETATFVVTGKGDPPTISYVDRAWDGGAVVASNATCAAYKPVTSGMSTAWSAGWYVVDSDVTIGSRIEISGAARLILCDGCTLTVQKGLHLTGAANSLTIYGQANDGGVLTINGVEQYNAGIGGNGNTSGNGENGGKLTVNGGNVTANGGKWAAGIGGGVGGSGVGGGGGDVTVNGGIVMAKAGSSYASAIGGGWGWQGVGASGTLIIDGMKVYDSQTSMDADEPVAPALRESTCRSTWVGLKAFALDEVAAYIVHGTSQIPCRTLKEALDAAEDGDTVMVLKALAESGSDMADVSGQRAITIDLNGFDVSFGTISMNGNLKTRTTAPAAADR